MKPKAVIINDIHFTIPTLELATESLLRAWLKAEELVVPLIIAGDTLDSKDIIRGTVANRLIRLFETHGVSPDTCAILVGNHDMVNEKGGEHTLNFLKPFCSIIQDPVYEPSVDAYLIPYQNDPERLRQTLGACTKSKTLIMHQGVLGANAGHYMQDRTAMPRDTFADFRVISGHYHRRQDIKCGRARKGGVGLFSYTGNPYTLSFGEAKDGEKGFNILNDDGSLTFVPLELRKHVILEFDIEGLDIFLCTGEVPKPEDLVWLKVTGPDSELRKLDKKEIGQRLLGHANFRLDLIPDKGETVDVDEKTEERTDEELLDSLIDASGETPEAKAYMKTLWKELVK